LRIRTRCCRAATCSLCAVSGFTGTVLLFDPQVEMAVILLTNHVYYTREKDAYLDYRRRILNALAAQVGEV
jgi:CubicO group peptidase (beta-lactamase class C family)